MVENSMARILGNWHKVTLEPVLLAMEVSCKSVDNLDNLYGSFCDQTTKESSLLDTEPNSPSNFVHAGMSPSE
ncbi:hypothetical protein UY3_01144 [Chelonia mydas]|uniref:Uncharacterized protein n=1 Tax=Chelonia mydas TaxID=8469 RepID=M7BWP0_CHEMY|nr:hypothetical protein UY3_01144 [Chelonia mydas]